VSHLKPKRIILHCGLHKTGSTYLQRNFKSKHKDLLRHGILYLGPTTFKKQLRLLWKYLQWGENKTRPSQKLKLQALKALNEQSGDSPEKIHTILISFEAIFGTLRTGLIQKDQEKNSNRENSLGLYRYSKKRTKRLMRGLEDTFGTKDIDWTICFASRQQNDFIRSCNIQLIKEGHELKGISLEEFTKTSNFSYAKTSNLIEKLSSLKEQRNIKILPFSYENISDRSDPTIYLKNFVKLILPGEAKQIIPSLINKSESKNLHKNINPGISERGLDIAQEARPIFTKQEWKLFRKFLEKNFVKSI
jgi:hypothetical protein